MRLITGREQSFAARIFSDVVGDDISNGFDIHPAVGGVCTIDQIPVEGVSANLAVCRSFLRVDAFRINIVHIVAQDAIAIAFIVRIRIRTDAVVRADVNAFGEPCFTVVGFTAPVNLGILKCIVGARAAEMNDLHSRVPQFEAGEKIMICTVEHDGLLSAGDGKTRKNPPIRFEVERVAVGASLIEDRIASSTQDDGIRFRAVRTGRDCKLARIRAIHQVNFRARRRVCQGVLQRIRVIDFDGLQCGKIARIGGVHHSTRAARAAGSGRSAHTSVRRTAATACTARPSSAARAARIHFIAGLTGASGRPGAARTTRESEQNRCGCGIKERRTKGFGKYACEHSGITT